MPHETLFYRNGPVSWPPGSCHLTPLNFFLRCYGKLEEVLLDKQNRMEPLEDNTMRLNRRMQIVMLEKQTEN